ncbi:MAG: glycine--tRNA ligase subunit beta [Thermodesulfovibrionia bacterium]|nr:glycine--tRNA ligase subunit beta [Thermodesulfovibrionia bacterium]
MKPLLFEIGSEEMPARFISIGLASLKENFIRLLNKSSIEYGKIIKYATPRRLTLLIEDVSEKQKDRTIESLGPPKKIAFDDKGNPTNAALGFARSLNIDVKKLTIKKTERGEYVSATIEEKGKLSKDVLAGALPGLISSLHLPKTMKWGHSTLRFFRPIHWILTLFGSDIIPFELNGIKSGNISYGHRFLSPAAIEIEEPSSYLSLLLKNHVIADPARRKRVISNGLREIEDSFNCKVHEDDELLDTVTNLVEYPVVISGSFDDKYLALPKELLITVMKTHQKYFSLEDNDGNILPSFIVASNTKAENTDTVRKGAERVLRARLDDARFYYIEDQKKPLWDYTEELRKVTFQEKLGSLYQKAERISSLCSFIADKINFSPTDKLLRATMLSKADLVTGVVGEFPELQGCIGKVYALNSGEDKEIASAIYEHYLPRFPGDDLPSSKTGAIISLADKMDSIASFFFLGLIPTGSEDPFALRRQAAAIINILQSKDYPLPLDILIDNALENLNCSSQQKETLSEDLANFFNQRLEGILLSRGFGHDLITAVLSSKGLNMNDIKQRIEILYEFNKDPKFVWLLTAAKRVYNILGKEQSGEVNKNLLTEAAEKELFSVVGKVNDKLARADYRALFELEKPVNTFFDSVLVMDKDPQVKENRLALLLSVKKAFDTLGDFSKIME